MDEIAMAKKESALGKNTSIYSVPAVRCAEARYAALASGAASSLMFKAGQAAAQFALGLLGAQQGEICIACGPGNNGGDGFAMAGYLLRAGRTVRVLYVGKPEDLPPDAASAYAFWREAAGEGARVFSELGTDCVLGVDALFGIGCSRAPQGIYAAWIQALNALSVPRLALDVPSGLCAQTGRIFGICFSATHTLTFIGLKPGLLTLDGPQQCGEVFVEALGVEPVEDDGVLGVKVSPALFQNVLKPRLLNTHKGSFGDVLVLGGAKGMIGAALLAGRAALHLGAGRVYVGLLDAGALACDPVQPELMFRACNQLPSAAGVWVVGPGLGQSAEAVELLEMALSQLCALVLDADALNIIAAHPDLKTRLVNRAAPTILTPHPAEAGRLTGLGTAAIQADRVKSAVDMAAYFHAWVLLKGCGSVIAGSDGAWFINTTGNPGLASGGTGDVLSGFIGALLAQAWPVSSALLAAVHLHGLAAEALAQALGGMCGFTAQELLVPARRLLNAWVASAVQPK